MMERKEWGEGAEHVSGFGGCHRFVCVWGLCHSKISETLKSQQSLLGNIFDSLDLGVFGLRHLSLDNAA